MCECAMNFSLSKFITKQNKETQKWQLMRLASLKMNFTRLLEKDKFKIHQIQISKVSYYQLKVISTSQWSVSKSSQWNTSKAFSYELRK